MTKSKLEIAEMAADKLLKGIAFGDFYVDHNGEIRHNSYVCKIAGCEPHFIDCLNLEKVEKEQKDRFKKEEKKVGVITTWRPAMIKREKMRIEEIL